MDIHRFLALPHRFRWGGLGGEDCMTFPARWALESIGVDPAEELRGTYRTRLEAHTLLDTFGGIVALSDHFMVSIGAKRIQNPETGDVAVIKAVTGESYEDQHEALIGAIKFGPNWACIHPAGVRATPAEFVAAWRLPA